MAVLQKIRGWGIWLSLIIAFALLLFLVDPSVISRLFGSGVQRETYGYIAGEEVTNEEFYEITRTYNFPDKQEGYQRAWQKIVDTRLLNPWFAEAGVRVSDALIDEELAAYPEEYLQYFGRDYLREALATDRQYGAYSDLFYQTAFPTDAYLSRLYKDRNTNITVDYIALDAPRGEVEVSDEEIAAAFASHKYGWSPRSTDVEIVNIHVYPSEEDMAQATEKYQQSYEEFCTTDNVAGFLRRNADEKSKSIRFYAQGELPAELDELVFGQGINQTEILSRGEDFTSARVLSSQMRAPAGHVRLCAFLDEEKADSLLAVLNAGESVDSLRARHELTVYGTFPISCNKPSVDIPDASGNRMPVDMGADFLDRKVGEYAMKDRYNTRFVYALTDKEEPQLLKEVAVYAKHVLPSKKTYNTVSDSVKVFYSAAQNLDMLAEAGPRFGKMATVYDMTVLDTVTVYRTKEGPLGNMKSITKSIFSHNTGDVIFTANPNTNDLFLIGVKSFRAEGPARLDEVKDQLSRELKIRKAAEQRLAAVREEMAGMEDFEAITAQFGKTSVHQVLSSASDPRLMGAARALNQGEIGAIDGLDGKVYVFRIAESVVRNAVEEDRLRDNFYREEAIRNLQRQPISYILRQNNVTSYLDRLF